MAAEQLRKRQLAAPGSGVITEMVPHVGEACQPYQPLVRLVDIRQRHRRKYGGPAFGCPRRWVRPLSSRSKAANSPSTRPAGWSSSAGGGPGQRLAEGEGPSTRQQNSSRACSQNELLRVGDGKSTTTNSRNWPRPCRSWLRPAGCRAAQDFLPRFLAAAGKSTGADRWSCWRGDGGSGGLAEDG